MNRMIKKLLRGGCLSLAFVLTWAGCSPSGNSSGGSSGAPQMTVGVAFETLQTEFWVAALGAFRDELGKRHIKMIEAIADGDANRQLEQVRNFITRKVDGIVVVPKDAKTIIPAIKAANQANIPIVSSTVRPDKSERASVTVVADNYAITKATVEYMVQQARKTGRKHKAHDSHRRLG